MACREQAPRDGLLRLVVAPDGRVVADLKGSLPGRGAWVHPTRSCLELAASRPRGLRRALRRDDARVDGLVDQVVELTRARVLHGLSLAAAGGHLVGGHDEVVRHLQRGGVACVVTATDASARTLRSIRGAADDSVPFVALALTRVELGARVGARERAVLAVRAVPATATLVLQLRRLVALG